MSKYKKVLYVPVIVIPALFVSIVLISAGNIAGYMSGGLLLAVLFIDTKRRVERLAIRGYEK